jgi:predicted MPP superfamily phosphohydrolase
MGHLSQDHIVNISLLIFLFAGLLSTPTITISYGIKLAAVGDISCNDNGNKTIKQITDSQPQLVLFLGDLAYNDNPQCFFDSTMPLEKTSTVLVAIGNHDDEEEELREKNT